MLESKKIKLIQELTERRRSVRYIAKKLKISTKTVVKYRKPNHIANEQTDKPQAETILTAEDPQWQRFAGVCNKLGDPKLKGPKSMLTELMKVYSGVAEKAGRLDLKIKAE